jgi:ABC-type microcin C transport system permease subunit YejE
MRYSYVEPPYGILAFGVFSLLAAVVGTCTGQAWGRFGGVVHRAKRPKEFWLTIAMQYLGGVGFIGYYLYKVYGR